MLTFRRKLTNRSEPETHNDRLRVCMQGKNVENAKRKHLSSLFHVIVSMVYICEDLGSLHLPIGSTEAVRV